MKNFSSLLFALMVMSITSCTDQQMAKQYGGTETITLPENQKLVNATWKENNLWYLTKDMSETDSAETYTFHEQSNFGVWEGTVIIKEVKK